MSTLTLPSVYAEEENAIGVLLVSSNSRLKSEFRDKLQVSRWRLSEVASGCEALEQLQQSDAKIVLLDPNLPDLQVDDFRALCKNECPEAQVISINPETGMLVLGTTSPNGLAAELKDRVYGNEGCRSHIPGPTKVVTPITRDRLAIPDMVGGSAVMQRVYRMVHKVAVRNSTVLVTGESGTGKDLVASAIHSLSDRHRKPLVTINCAAIPEPLLEAELFGYTKGSFTGALQARIGRIQSAHGGTLFLDEIGDMPLALQSKILRFLEHGEVQRIGGNDNLKVDVRVVAATNAKLESLVEQKLFREDLYYRLNIFPIDLPPLRERHGDVRELAEHFLRKIAPGTTLKAGAVAVLEKHNWRGNVRELRNVIERASIMADESREILAEHIFI